MTRQTLAFFSSDARQLYKADIFRALALPQNYVLQFRYKNKDIENKLLINIKEFLNQEGLIFFASGNDTTIEQTKRDIRLYAIRKVLVREVYVDDNLGNIHFYLELKEFANTVPHSDTPKDLLPPVTAVSRITVEDSPNNTWIDRVYAVESHFSNSLFYTISSIKHNDRILIPEYSARERASHYNLNDEEKYDIHISFYDPNSGSSGLRVQDSEGVSLFIQPGHRVGAKRDTSIFRLSTHTLSRQNALAVSKLLSIYLDNSKQVIVNDDYYVELRWQLSKSSWKTWQFGLFSALAASGVLVGNAATKDFSTLSLDTWNFVVGFVSVMLIGASASFLYKIFNKK